jgi:hypothetical protein
MNKSDVLGLFYASLLTVGLSTSAHASIVSLVSTIDGSQANAGAGTRSSGVGTATMTLDDVTNKFTWDVQWSGLTGDVSVAHFHGPALPGVNASVQVEIDVSLNPSPGMTMLTDAQETDLLAGLWYINIHSDFEPGGEIRGQVNVVPIPGAVWLLGSGMLGLIGLLKQK